MAYDWITDATDMAVVAEVYPPDAVPPFDPADALKRYASVADVVVAGQPYKPQILSFGSFTRTVGDEIPMCDINLDNLDRDASRFEFGTGFEGCILVVRWVSRSNAVDLGDTFVLWAGRLQKPESGTREEINLTAKFMLGSLWVKMPRRRFTPEDRSARNPADPLYEGFRFMPQYGNETYSKRGIPWRDMSLLRRRFGKGNSLSWSSFSDIDQEKFLPEIFGRTQVAGTNLAYADIGLDIKSTTAFCEGEILGFVNFRSTDTRWSVKPTPVVRYGKEGGTGDQIPLTDANWPGNGYYSRTALVFSTCGGSNLVNEDPAPVFAAVISGKLVTVPDGDGDWTATRWSDNGAAIVRHLITDPDYFNLPDAWIDDASFYRAHEYNDEIIYDRSDSELLVAPQTDTFTETQFLGTELRSTSVVDSFWFNYLAEEGDLEEHLERSPSLIVYTDDEPLDGISQFFERDSPEDPDVPPPGGGRSAYFTFLMRRRYTTNFSINEEKPLIDILNETILIASRMYFGIGTDGRITLDHKKPAPGGFLTDSVASDGDELELDDVSWFDGPTLAVLDPYSSTSEVVEVTGLIFPATLNDITLTASSGITVTAFTGADGGTTPASATITVDGPFTELTEYSVTLDGISIFYTFRTYDTETTFAGFIWAAINGHPVLGKRFRAEWDGMDEVTVYTRKGLLTLSEGTIYAHEGAVTDPVTGPTLTVTTGGNLAPGSYRVLYAFANGKGRTNASAYAVAGINSAGGRIQVTAITPPTGCDVLWYMSSGPTAWNLRLVNRNGGEAFNIDTAPGWSAELPPDRNTTGSELIAIKAVFSDREEERSGAERANVLKATYEWSLGDRENPVNQIEVKFRDAAQDFRLVTLRLGDKEHIEKVRETNSEEVDGTAIDSWHQAYRLASNTLAEKRDGDFFYRWTADRNAGLLKEGDVVTVTDDGAEIYNLPVRIEEIEVEVEGGMPRFTFTARKYNYTLYDDSVAERIVPIVVEPTADPTYIPTEES
jgi:hypothetical protein